MAFDWKDYLPLATELSNRSDQASLRSAISRAYYAVFGRATELLVSVGHAIADDGSAHTTVWSIYEQADDGPLHYIGFDGARLKRLRRRADYDSSVTYTGREAREAIKVADRTIAALARNATPLPNETTSDESS